MGDWRAGPVVVGVDPVPRSCWGAMLTGAWEARHRRAPLVLLHGHDAAVSRWPFAVGPYPQDPDLLAGATGTLTTAAAMIRDRFPDLAVDTRLWTGSAAGGLVEASHGARLVVVGASGSGGLTVGSARLTIGSVAAQTVSHARCPVLVVRPPGSGADEADVPHAGPVVVGVDGSAVTDAALAFAFDEASMRGVPLVALNSWWLLPRKNLGPVYPGTYDEQEEAFAEARRLLSEAVAGWSSKYPDVPVEPRSVHEMSPSLALVHASRGAGLVVVGSRGRGGFAGLLLGSVGRDLVASAESPVAVVHPGP